jgi:hypothetical protein
VKTAERAPVTNSAGYACDSRCETVAEGLAMIVLRKWGSAISGYLIRVTKMHPRSDKIADAAFLDRD